MELPETSLDIIEWVMAMEEAFPHLDPEARERLVRELKARFDRGELDDSDLDDDDFAAFVRKLGPRGPRSQSGAAAKPEEPFGE